MKKEYLIYKLSDEMKSCIRIDADLFRKFDVKRDCVMRTEPVCLSG